MAAAVTYAAGYVGITELDCSKVDAAVGPAAVVKSLVTRLSAKHSLVKPLFPTVLAAAADVLLDSEVLYIVSENSFQQGFYNQHNAIYFAEAV